MSEVEQFKSQVEEYLQRTAMTPTRFGKVFARDPLFVFQLREGREPRSALRGKILEAMSSAGAENG